MQNLFLTNYTDKTFLDKIKESFNKCNTFSLSVSFIKKAGLILIEREIEEALDRGVIGKIITSTYQNFTDIASLNTFIKWMNKYFDIEKINIPVYDPNICNTTSKALKFLTSYLLKSISEKERMDIIEFLQNGLNAQERHRFGKNLKELIGDSSMTKEEPLITELNYKIRMHVLLELGIL